MPDNDTNHAPEPPGQRRPRARAARRRALSGSERARPAGHDIIGPANADDELAVTIVVRPKAGAPPLPDLGYWQRTPLRERRFLTAGEYAERYGADPADLDAVAAFATAHGLTVLDSHAGRHTVSVLGTVGQLNAAFGVTLNRYRDHLPPQHPRSPEMAAARHAQPEQAHSEHYGYDGAVQLPADIAGVVAGVVGLDTRHLGVPAGDPVGAAYNQVPVTAQSYNFPNPGAGDQTIGVLAMQNTGVPGSGAAYLKSDITGSYFPGLPTGYQKAPKSINDVNLTVGTTTYKNNPAAVQAITSTATANNAILELTQDISTSATIAQGATVNVYFTEASENGLLVFLNRLLQPETEQQPTVVTSSFGIYLGDDSSYIGKLSDSGSVVSLMTSMLQALAALGISVFWAIGDWGADNWYLLAPPNNTAPDGKSHVTYPGTDPWVTACGGTILGSTTEVTWSDAWSTTSNFGGDFATPTNQNSNFGATAGGVSATFPAPPYQSSAGITGATDSAGTAHAGRSVPDVAGMVGYTGYFANGLAYNYVGTSCVAPLYAGLAAVLRSALGVALGPLNPILYQLRNVAFNDITAGNNDSHDTPANVASVIPGYTGTTPDAPYFSAGAGWDACTGLGSIDGTKLLNGIASALYNPNFYFQVNKGTFGLDEVRLNATYANPAPMRLVLEGFTPNAVAAAGIAPTVTSSLPGVTVAVGAAQPEIASAPDTPQRVYFPCSIAFAAKAINTIANGGIFPPPGSPPTPTQILLLAPSVTIAGRILPPAETTLALEPDADPYFANFATNGQFYLSQDLRVFTVTPGIPALKAPIDGIALNASDNTHWDTGAAYTYIQNLLKHLNSAYSSPAGTDPFTLFPDQNNALSGDSSVTPTQADPAHPTGTPFTNYNFAVAKVRLSGAPNTTTNANVRVMFRLFASQTGDTDFQPLTYPSTTDSEGQPLAPLLGVGDVTIPFFATGNYEHNGDFAANTDYSGTSINNQPVSLGGSGQVWAYYGCYLNIYPTSNTIGGKAVQTLLPSTHSCVVAQIVYDDAPYPAGPGVVLGPEYSDQFAQRNLQITFSDNPGPPSTHRVPQTFDTRPGPAPTSGQLGNYPDELMINWGDTPVGSTASIYWPAVSSADVLALAGELYSTHQLSAADAHTIQCVVPDGVTNIPIPSGPGANYAGLFTVDLPPGVTAGQTYTITIQRISTHPPAAAPPPPPPPPQIEAVPAGGAAAAAAREIMRAWRYVVGTFAVRIPVTTPDVMLPAEENTLAIMKWRRTQLPPANRWIPVLDRFIGLIEGRVGGLGGDPGAIEPSPWGSYGPPPEDHGHRRYHEATGKISGVVYDRFGDFEGFCLRTEEGHERAYRCREEEMEILVRYAWAERVVVTVTAEDEEPIRIMLRRRPLRLE
jgi:hypothetical protein